MRLLAGQERVEALLRDAMLNRELTGSSASTGDFMSQKRSKWNRKAGVAETSLTRAAIFTPPASARSAPTPRNMQLPGGGMLSYNTALLPQLLHERRPSRLLQSLSPRLPHAKDLDCDHHELKNTTNMPKPSLHKLLDVDLHSPTNLDSNETTLTHAPSTTSAENDPSEANFQNEMAETPSNCQRASEPKMSSPAKHRKNGITEEKEREKESMDEAQDCQEGRASEKKNCRITTLTSASVDAAAEDTNWDASAHWRKMIRKQERKMYNGKTKTKLSFDGTLEDVPDTRLAIFIKGQVYENIGIILVVINAIFIGWQVEHMAGSNTNLPFRMPVEMIFAILFTGEFIGKAYAWGLGLFSRGPQNPDLLWNIFDLIVVFFMWLELAMELHIIPESEVSSVSILRILRILRLVRVVKIIRTLKFFRELRLMILAISKGSLCLVWVMGVLGTAFYIFGVGLTQGANDLCPGFIYSDGQEELKHLCDNFGNLAKSILSLYAAMSGGISWVELFNALQPLGLIYRSIFLFYTMFSIFAVVNIITGIFVESAMASSNSDHDSLVEGEMQKKEQYVDCIHKVFMDLDSDASGTIAVAEFEQVVKSDKMAAYFNALGLEITDVKSLFALMDRDRTGAIDIEEFLVGCLRLKGEARSLDLAKLSLQTEFMMETLENICDGLRDTHGVLAKPTWRQ